MSPITAVVLIVALALLTATTALAADSPTPATYADSALSLAGHITAALPAVTAAADSIADRMIAGHTLWLGGSYEGLIVEGYYRAGGMMKAAATFGLAEHRGRAVALGVAAALAARTAATTTTNERISCSLLSRARPGGRIRGERLRVPVLHVRDDGAAEQQPEPRALRIEQANAAVREEGHVRPRACGRA